MIARLQLIKLNEMANIDEDANQTEPGWRFLRIGSWTKGSFAPRACLRSCSSLKEALEVSYANIALWLGQVR